MIFRYPVKNAQAFFACILVALAILVMYLDLNDSASIRSIRALRLHAMAAVLSKTQDLRSPMVYIVKQRNQDDLVQQMKETSSRADMLSLHMQAIMSENHALKRLLNYISSEAAYKDIKYVTTRVLSLPYSTSSGLVYISVGTADGIQVGQAVINEKGLVGKIVNTTENSSEIMLVTDPRFRIPVLMRDSGERAIFIGSTMSLSFAHKNYSVFNGEMAVTLGDYKSFPARLPVGIARITQQQLATITYIDVFADTTKLDYVLVIIS